MKIIYIKKRINYLILKHVHVKLELAEEMWAASSGG